MSDPNDTWALTTQIPHVAWNLLSAASPSTGDGDPGASGSGRLCRTLIHPPSWRHLPGHACSHCSLPDLLGEHPGSLARRGWAGPRLLLWRLQPALLTHSAAVSLASLLLL